MIVLPQCLSGGRNHCGHTPTAAWTDDCQVQWGGRGWVHSPSHPDGSYFTAFFEAFTKDPDAFFRGEGKTVSEAEQNCWARFVAAKQCTSHVFERRGYRNGGGICKHCGLFQGDVFEPLDTCVVCGCATYYTTDKYGRWYCEQDIKRVPFNALNGWQQDLIMFEREETRKVGSP